MRRLFLFLFFALAMALGVVLNHSSRFRDVYRSVCDLAENHFYKSDQRLEAWVKRCRYNAARVPLWQNERRLLGMIQDQLNELNVSHFQIYDPAEDQRLWTGESIDTGIRSRYVDDTLIIYRVYPGSAADDVDVRVGDEVLAIEGTDQVTPWGAMSRSGLFRLRRQGQTFDVNLQSRTIAPDLSPQVKILDARTAVLEIPSFRSNFFAREDWRKVTARFLRSPHLIVDIRENSGGNFVAMLRVLSTFTCGDASVGQILQPRKRLPQKRGLDDDTSDAHQISELEKFRSVGLRTFPGYGCYTGRVTVLVGPETASVSEIFAHSFLSRAGARVWGQPTAGDVVLAVWYDLPALGKGYSVSIPEAVYLTPQKLELEAHGVSPQKELQYDLKQSLQGKDSWIEDAR